MAIPLDLLKLTEKTAPGICIYGGVGLKKTHGICTLPPPVLAYDIGERGTASILPWIRRRRNWDENEWTYYTDEDRQGFIDILDKDTKLQVPIPPYPLVDVISYDNLDPRAFESWKTHFANFDFKAYNSLAIDSLQELSIMIQVFKKGRWDGLMNEVSFGWVAVQEHCGQHLRKMRNMRGQGICIYLTGAQDIAKDYVKNPMSKREQGESEPTPFSVKGTVQLPGQMAEALSHLPDVLAHARLINGQVRWITEPEMLPGGEAHWDAKDRYGRLEKYEPPTVRGLFKKIYGKEGFDAIYDYGEAMCK